MDNKENAGTEAQTLTAADVGDLAAVLGSTTETTTLASSEQQPPLAPLDLNAALEEDVLELNDLVGMELTEELKETVQGYYPRVRFLFPGSVVTHDYIESRLNVCADREKIITGCHFG